MAMKDPVLYLYYKYKADLNIRCRLQNFNTKMCKQQQPIQNKILAEVPQLFGSMGIL